MIMKFSKGRVGDKSAFFDGTTSAEIVELSTLPKGKKRIIVCFWLKLNGKAETDNPQTIFSYGSIGNRTSFPHNSIICSINDPMGEPHLGFSFDKNTYINKEMSDYKTKKKIFLPKNEWFHLGGAFTNEDDRGYIKFYINGNFVGVYYDETTAFLNISKAILSLGKPYGTSLTQYSNFNGKIKDFQIFTSSAFVYEYDDVIKDVYEGKEVTDCRVLQLPLQDGKDDDSLFKSKSFVYSQDNYTTSSGFNSLGKPIRYRSASQAGVNYSPIPTKGLIFYAPCETDASVKVGNQFTTSGEFATQVADDIKCLKFNVPYTQEVDTNVFVRNQVTLSALYYKKQTNTSGIILGYGVDSRYCYFALEEYYGQFYVNHAMARLGTGYNMQDDTWYHLALTLDNTTINAYVNGELVSTFTCDMNLHSGDIGLGGWAYGNGSDSPNGYITKARIYNRPLTEKEIQLLYKEYKGV